MTAYETRPTTPHARITTPPAPPSIIRFGAYGDYAIAVTPAGAGGRVELLHFVGSPVGTVPVVLTTADCASLDAVGIAFCNALYAIRGRYQRQGGVA
jgi:hypothetical protein